MAAEYFVHNLNGERLDLDDVGLTNHIKQKQSGELFLVNNAGIKIGYDRKTGSAIPLSALQTGSVNNSFADGLFHKNLGSISRVIRELAKLNLLWALLELKDPIISGTILKNHMQTETGDLSNTKEEALDDTLFTLQQKLAPTISSAFFKGRDARNVTQKVVYEELTSVNLESIQSEDAVEAIMTSIRTKITAARNDNVANSADYSNPKNN